VTTVSTFDGENRRHHATLRIGSPVRPGLLRKHSGRNAIRHRVFSLTASTRTDAEEDDWDGGSGSTIAVPLTANLPTAPEDPSLPIDGSGTPASMPGSRKKQLELPYVSETQTLDGLKMRFIVTKIGACSSLDPLVRNGYLVRTPAERRKILRTDRAHS